MLRCLTGKHHVPFRDRTMEEIVQPKCKTTLQRCRRRHTCAQRYIAGKNGIKTFHIHAALDQFAGDTIDEAETGCLGTLGVIDRPFGIVLQIHRIGANSVRTVRTDDRHDTLLHRTREDETAIIIRVLTDEVDTTGRSIDRSPLSKSFCKSREKKLFIHIIEIYKIVK